MCRPAQYGLRLLVVIATVSLIPMLFTTPGPARGPYVSALSNLAVQQTFAASTCNFKACAGGSRFNIQCAKVTTASNCTTYKGFCLPNNCP